MPNPDKMTVSALQALLALCQRDGIALVLLWLQRRDQEPVRAYAHIRAGVWLVSLDCVVSPPLDPLDPDEWQCWPRVAGPLPFVFRDRAWTLRHDMVPVVVMDVADLMPDRPYIIETDDPATMAIIDKVFSAARVGYVNVLPIVRGS